MMLQHYVIVSTVIPSFLAIRIFGKQLASVCLKGLVAFNNTPKQHLFMGYGYLTPIELSSSPTILFLCASLECVLVSL